MSGHKLSEFIKFVDVTKCDGCRACMVACKNWNDLPAEPEEFHGSIQSHEALTANTWNIITYDEHETNDGGFEWLFRHDHASIVQPPDVKKHVQKMQSAILNLVQLSLTMINVSVADTAFKAVISMSSNLQPIKIRKVKNID